jgi:hypothetical protein
MQVSFSHTAAASFYANIFSLSSGNKECLDWTRVVDLDSFESGSRSGSSLFCQSGFGSKPNPDPNPNQIRIRIQTKSGSESKPNPDPNPEPDPNRIRIEKKGWIRIQMNPDPQPCWIQIQFPYPGDNYYAEEYFLFIIRTLDARKISY